MRVERGCAGRPRRRATRGPATSRRATDSASRSSGGDHDRAGAAAAARRSSPALDAVDRLARSATAAPPCRPSRAPRAPATTTAPARYGPQEARGDGGRCARNYTVGERRRRGCDRRPRRVWHHSRPMSDAIALRNRFAMVKGAWDEHLRGVPFPPWARAPRRRRSSASSSRWSTRCAAGRRRRPPSRPPTRCGASCTPGRTTTPSSSASRDTTRSSPAWGTAACVSAGLRQACAACATSRSSARARLERSQRPGRASYASWRAARTSRTA